MSIVRLQGGGLRFLDAHESHVITRPLRDVDRGQHWEVTDLGDGVSTIQQVSSGRFLAVHGNQRVVTRARRDSASQRWRIEDFGGGFATIEHVGSGRFLEATVEGDFTVVMRPAGDSEQTWRIGDP
jgi:hypothetical protein